MPVQENKQNKKKCEVKIYLGTKKPTVGLVIIINIWKQYRANHRPPQKNIKMVELKQSH